jgi:hypothetical protein
VHSTIVRVLGSAAPKHRHLNTDMMPVVTRVADAKANLHVEVHKGFLCRAEAAQWWDTIMQNMRWFRVKYKSARFGNECETPCWTGFFGGFPEFKPFEAVPEWLKPLVARVRVCVGGAPFNAMLVRLYFDGNDEIAWHTGIQDDVFTVYVPCDCMHTSIRYTYATVYIHIYCNAYIDSRIHTRTYVTYTLVHLTQTGVSSWARRPPSRRSASVPLQTFRCAA